MYEHPWEPLGNALLDYFNGDNDATMSVVSDFEIPVMMSAELFFRNPEWFPMLEQTALRQCSGRVLDIGAGAGSHALTLQELGAPVTAIDVSVKAVQVMKGRGIKDARCTDFFNFRIDEKRNDLKYDTLLMLMNGIGIVGNLSRLEKFFEHAKTLIKSDGARQIILDSFDLRESLSKTEFAARKQDKSQDYYGEVRYRLEYKGKYGPGYSWLYVDPDTLTEYANRSGWLSDGIWPEEDGRYLTKLVCEGV